MSAVNDTHNEPQSASSHARHLLDSLEPDQLVSARQRPLSRRILKPSEVLLFWSLRLYLLFMMAVMMYQVWIATH